MPCPPPPFLRFVGAVALTALAAPMAPAADREPLDAAFATQVRPLLQRYCYECHNPDEEKGDVDLRSLQTVAAFGEHGAVLDGIITVVTDHEMPPRKAEHQPTDAERTTIVEWMKQAHAAAQEATPNDPGRVVMPRLNHREYNFVIRDLTGLPIDAAQNFPRDGGGGEGFQNVGETHAMSPMQAEKYLKAARWIVDHAQILPDGTLLWYGTPLLPTGAESQFDLLVRRWEAMHLVIAQRAYAKREALIKQAYGSPVVPYWVAAWRYQHRAALGIPNATFEQIAAEDAGVLNPVTLRRWHAFLTTREPQSRYLQSLLDTWRALPAPAGGGTAASVREPLMKLEDWSWKRFQIEAAGFFRQKIPAYEVIAAKGDRKAEEAFAKALTKEGRYAARVDFSKLPKDAKTLYLGVSEGDDGPEGDVVVFKRLDLVNAAGTARPLTPNDPALKVEAGQPISWTADGLKVRAPFLISYVPGEGAKELAIEAELDRGAGRNGTVQMIVSHERPAELTFVPRRSLMAIEGNPRASAFWTNVEQLRTAVHNNFVYAPGNIFAEYPGVDPAWSPRPAPAAPTDPAEDLRKPFRLPLPALRADAWPEEATELANLARGMAASRDRGTPGPFPEAVVQRAAGEFAAQAWRRPVDASEIAALTHLYRTSLAAGATSEAALRQTLAAVLVSPHFLYRAQTSRGADQPYELTDLELASRLSFFLWASKPDDELLKAATEGRLRHPAALQAQARRMLRDPRARALATEFAANWLHFDGFDTFTAPDTTRFPEFKPSLRKAMYEESVLFFDDLFRNDGPVLNVLEARHTFLNQELAKHYGIDGVLGPQMRKVALKEATRGGVLGMGSILTRTSKPLRTSPVLRGDWLLVNLLGTPTPPAPDDVPLLSDDEKNPEGLTLAQQLAAHRDKPSCRSCHEKLDPLGFAMENFDPIGRWRTKMASGDAVDSQGRMADGRTLDGLDGLRAYLRDRQDLILENFCRKLAGYALGRGVRVTDVPLLTAMKTALQRNGTRFSAALDVLVTSPQFRTRRDVPTPTTTKNHEPQAVPSVAQNSR